VKRREFITLLAGAAVVWPFAVSAQQAERMRRIGVLMSTASDHLESKARLAAFLQRLQGLGWVDGRNVRIDGRRSELWRSLVGPLPGQLGAVSAFFWPLCGNPL
jgi:hypothetical protein